MAKGVACLATMCACTPPQNAPSVTLGEFGRFTQAEPQECDQTGVLHLIIVAIVCTADCLH